MLRVVHACVAVRCTQALLFTLTTCLCLAISPSLMAAETNHTGRLADISEHPMRSAPATALSLNNTTLSARIQASVDSIAVGVSEVVQSGDTLLQLDCTDYDLALQQAQSGVTIAEARLSLAQSQKQRTNQLLQKDLTTRENADTTLADAIARKAELEQAKINLQQARINVERCTIKAPFDGIITARLASEGQLATIGTALITLIDTQRLELSAQVKPDEVSQLQQAPRLTFVADEEYPVQLLRLGGSINSATRDQEIRLQFTGTRPPPGSAGKLVWADPRSFVPARYIVSRDQQLGLFVAENGKARFIPLPTAVPGRAVPVTLAADTLIVINKLGTLQSGDPLP